MSLPSTEKISRSSSKQRNGKLMRFEILCYDYFYCSPFIFVLKRLAFQNKKKKKRKPNEIKSSKED